MLWFLFIRFVSQYNNTSIPCMWTLMLASIASSPIPTTFFWFLQELFNKWQCMHISAAWGYVASSSQWCNASGANIEIESVLAFLAASTHLLRSTTLCVHANNVNQAISHTWVNFKGAAPLAYAGMNIRVVLHNHRWIIMYLIWICRHQQRIKKCPKISINLWDCLNLTAFACGSFIIKQTGHPRYTKMKVKSLSVSC